MKLLKSIIFSAFSFLALQASASPDMLADRHVQKGNTCAACHTENPPAQAVPTSQCQKCHGDYEALKQKTSSLKPNPHYTHMGDQPCEECHKGHSTPVNMCATCHKIKLNVK